MRRCVFVLQPCAQTNARHACAPTQVAHLEPRELCFYAILLCDNEIELPNLRVNCL